MESIVPPQPESKPESFIGRPKLRGTALLSLTLAAGAVAAYHFVPISGAAVFLAGISVISAGAALFFWRTETPMVMAKTSSQLQVKPPVIH